MPSKACMTFTHQNRNHKTKPEAYLCSECAEIEFAEEDKVVTAYTTPNDPGVSQQWALYQLGLFTDSPLDNGLVEQGAWNRTYGGDVIVCVIDSGVDYTHPGMHPYRSRLCCSM